MSRYTDGDIITDDGGRQGTAWIRGHFSEPDAAWIVGNEHDAALSADVWRRWARWSLERWEDEDGEWHSGGYFRCPKDTRGAFPITVVEYVEEDAPVDHCEHPRPRHGWRTGPTRSRMHRLDNQIRADRLAMGAA